MEPDRLGDWGEREIIKMLADAFGIPELDDAAPLDSDATIFLSGDMMLQSTDLPSNTNPLFWGHRFIASNVSDMAAMGCKPISMLVSLGLPGRMKVQDLRKMVEGMQWACRESGLGIIGGDTNASSELVLSGFIAGKPFGRPFRRSGARAGDVLFVTGNPGSAALGLAVIKSRPETYFECPDIVEEDLGGSAVAVGSFLAPEMRIREAHDLSEMDVVTSCIDISDGISTDAGHIAESSGVKIVIEESELPFPKECRGLARHLKLDPTGLALNGGDDYELLFTAPSEAEAFIAKSKLATRIGSVSEGHGVAIRRPGGRVENLKSSGYQHLAGIKP